HSSRNCSSVRVDCSTTGSEPGSCCTSSTPAAAAGNSNRARTMNTACNTVGAFLPVISKGRRLSSSASAPRPLHYVAAIHTSPDKPQPQRPHSRCNPQNLTVLTASQGLTGSPHYRP